MFGSSAQAVATPIQLVRPLTHALAPLAHAIAPSAHDIAPSAHDIAPSAQDVLPLAHSITPAAHAIAPAVHDVAPSAHAIAPAVHDVAPLAHAIAPAAHGIAPVAHGIAPAAHDNGVDVQPIVGGNHSNKNTNPPGSSDATATCVGARLARSHPGRPGRLTSQEAMDSLSSMGQAKNDSKPKKDATGVTQVGLKAYQLTQQYSAQLAGRLDANLVSTLQSDLTSLGVLIPAAMGARVDSKQSTIAQHDALSTAYDHVTAVRHAVARKQPAPAVKAAYGVGNRTSKRIVKDVVNALQKIVDRATAEAAEAAGFGITAADVTSYKAHVQAVKDADTAQEKARANAPLSTKQRNVVLRRILAAVDSISGAGVVAFATSPTERAQFEALVKKK